MHINSGGKFVFLVYSFSSGPKDSFPCLLGRSKMSNLERYVVGEKGDEFGFGGSLHAFRPRLKVENK